MKIVEGVHMIEGVSGCHVYLVEGDERLVVIDTGMPGASKKVLKAIAAIGRNPQDVGEIVVTHYHGDHTGSLAGLAAATGAQVCAHALDAPVVRGDQPMPLPGKRGLVRRLFGPLLSYVERPRPSRVDRELQDGDEIESAGLRVLHTPGHTPGHISLFLASKKALFVGDAIINVMGLRPQLGLFTLDKAQARESIRKLAAVECDVVCFAHGRPLLNEGSAQLRRFAEGLR